jgi:hypothetical protein
MTVDLNLAMQAVVLLLHLLEVVVAMVVIMVTMVMIPFFVLMNFVIVALTR